MISLIVKLLKFFSVLIFAVIFLELTVRFLYPQNITPTHITVKYDIPNSLKSNFKQEGVNSLGVRYRVVTNEKSLRRDAPIKYKKDDNIYRILVLGDSIAYGRGVGNRETFSFYLENLLKKAKPGINFEVLNSAVPYWGPLQYYFYMKNEGYKYNSDLIILALESSNAEELNMHQIQFKKSYHKKTKTGLDIYFEDPKIIPYNITYLDIFRYKIVQTQLYEFVTSHSQLFNLVRWRLTQTLSPLSSANIINNTNKFFPTNFSPNHWVIKENGIEKKIVGLTRPKYVGIKILIEKIQNFVKNQGSEFFVFKIPYHNAVLERAVKTNYLNLLLPQTPIFDPLDNTGLFLNKYSIPLYFPGDIHFIPSGHKLMAYFLFNFLAKNNIKFKTLPKLLPFSLKQINEAILNSDSTMSNKAKLDPYWEFTQAMIHKNNKNYRKAKTLLNKYLKKKPNDYEANLQMGVIFIKEKNYAEAEKFLGKALRNNRGEINTKLSYLYSYATKSAKVWFFILKGEYDKALPYLEDLIKLQGQYQNEAYNLIALYYLKKGNMKMAKFYKNKISNFLNRGKPKVSLENLNDISNFNTLLNTEANHR